MRWLPLLVALMGCATAQRGSPLDQQPDGGITLLPDGGGGGGGGGRDAAPLPDAAQPDASSLSTTLSETTDSTVASAASITCSDSNDGTSRDNTWYRAFQLSDYPMITGAFHVTSVTFGVQEASAAAGVTVKVGTYGGAVGGSTIDTAQITSPASGTATIADTEAGETVNAPVTTDIPAGGKFVVEVVAPDLDGTGYLYIGATTTASETHPGYISSVQCGVTAPETTVAAGGTGRLIINVNGTY